MHSKKHIIVAQFFISGLMSLLMSGFFSFFHLGFTTYGLETWRESFLIAWPIAFTLSMIVGPIGFKISEMLLKIKT